MPTYEYKCPFCNNVMEDTVPSYKVRKESLLCTTPGCGAVSPRIMSRPYFTVDNTDRQGFNHGAGQYFSNKNEVKEYCRANNVVQGPTESVESVRKRRQERIEQKRQEKAQRMRNY